MNLNDTLTLWAPRVLSVLRIVAALIFLLHGTQKLLGFPPHPNPAGISTMSWIAGLLELVGGEHQPLEVTVGRVIRVGEGGELDLQQPGSKAIHLSDWGASIRGEELLETTHQ